LLLRFHSGEPSAEGFSQVVIQNLYASLKQQVRATLGPAHLLFLHKAFADHIVYGRFDERCCVLFQYPQIVVQVIDSLYGMQDITMPEIPFDAFQVFFQVGRPFNENA
jgi:hypothetical protein